MSDTPAVKLTKAQARAERIIADWREAFTAANGKPAPRVRYESGWFRIRNPYETRVRLAQVERWTETLRGRALLDALKDEGEAA